MTRLRSITPARHIACFGLRLDMVRVRPPVGRNEAPLVVQQIQLFHRIARIGESLLDFFHRILRAERGQFIRNSSPRPVWCGEDVRGRAKRGSAKRRARLGTQRHFAVRPLAE
ncbi:hypothetical protein, partial [Myxococcus qinghaiensis]|uniref:hypothetical protein n=1 Tax=Myxococcus qinghaiensis TaxID=2906758 RepID=UPI0020A7DCF7